MLINIYFPSAVSVSSRDSLFLIRDNLIDDCMNIDYSDICLGGDFNNNILLENLISSCIINKLSLINLAHLHNFLNVDSSNHFTFFVPTRSAFSLIDFFFLSPLLSSPPPAFQILHHFNLSDHLPSKISFPLSMLSTLSLSLTIYSCFSSSSSSFSSFKQILLYLG